jgi:hypothetical protein
MSDQRKQLVAMITAAVKELDAWRWLQWKHRASQAENYGRPPLRHLTDGMRGGGPAVEDVTLDPRQFLSGLR